MNEEHTYGELALQKISHTVDVCPGDGAMLPQLKAFFTATASCLFVVITSQSVLIKTLLICLSNTKIAK